MVGPTLGELLPVALAVALSPIPIIAVVVVVGAPRARTAGPAFAVGWIVGLLAITALAVVVLGGGDGEAHPEPGIDWGQVVTGGVLILLAAKTWHGRPRSGEAPSMPSWMATLDSATTGRALLLGAALSGANPKNLAMAVAAAATIAQAGLERTDTVLTVAGFVALGSCTVVGAVVASIAGGRRAEGALSAVREFMTANSAVIMMVVLLLLGSKLVGDGLGDLLR